jgi:urea transport system substrate-binding protein
MTPAVRKLLMVTTALLVIALGLAGLGRLVARERHPIRLGILHSLSGPMAISEKSMVDAELMAVEEINAAGGVLGQRVETVVVDGASDWPTFAREAERLITAEHVSAIVGCWTSACRKSVKPVVERHDQLLIYPMAYEGLEVSDNIVYTGSAPNQQIVPALKWSLDNLGKRVFLVGSDYVWPHSLNAIIRDHIAALNGEVAGEEYIFFGSQDVADAVEKIRASRPDAVISTVVGDSNFAFYRALRQAGLDATKMPVVSLSISEGELLSLDATDVAGHYSAWSYFQSVPRAENQSFVQRFRARYGIDRTTSDVIEAAYASVLLWAKAVEQGNSPDPDTVNETILGASINAPEGVITVDPVTRHTWRSFHVGKIRPDGQIDIVWSADHPIRPVPFPRTRSRVEWEQFLDELYQRWGHRWANPRPARAGAGT